MSRRALVVIGSRTSEDKYGIKSGLRVIAGLRRHGWDVESIHAPRGSAILSRLLNDSCDVVVPVGFGSPCEDGHIYAVARMAGVPCAGPTPGAGSLMQDKSVLNMIVDAVFPSGSGVRSPRGHTLTQALPQSVAEARVQSLQLPLVVKPAFSGSSEGLLVVDSHSQALAFAAASVAYEGKVLVQELEQGILAEVSCTVLDDKSGPHFLPIVELRRDDVLVLGPEEKFGPSGLDRHIIPARLDPNIVAKLEQVVLRLHEVVGAVGLTRTDVLLTRSGELVVLELNAIPGLLESSIACDAAAAAGIPFDDLCVLYAESAFLPRPEPRVWETSDREFSATDNRREDVCFS